MSQLVSSSTSCTLSETSTQPSAANSSDAILPDLISGSLHRCDSGDELATGQEQLLQNRVHFSPSVSYAALAIDRQADDFLIISEDTVSEAFKRLADSLALDEPHDSLMAVALYEFLTFTEAYGWQPLFFDVAERLVPVLRSQGLATVKQYVQGSEFRYLAYRDSNIALSDL
jgi:hypothetical protein